VSLRVSRFHGEGGVDEYNLIVSPTDYGTIGAQLEWVLRAYQDALESLGLDARSAVLRRFFCSDLANQAAVLESQPCANPYTDETACAISWIGQPPSAPAKVALWAYHINDPDADLDKSRSGATVSLRRGPLTHHWTTGQAFADASTSYAQTKGVLENYDAFLRAHGMTLADNVLRTWFFVQNIDADYQGLVTARREFFAAHGLTPSTHFIASTGIEGAYVDATTKVMMDTYAISGVESRQVQFLSAPENLCPTQNYGVTFERGTAIAYRDRKHVLISGTASIDPRGKILFPGNISRQLERALENVEALLKSAGAALHDMAHFIVYVRDPSDAAFAELRMRERFDDTPIQVVTAPVCRPGWLVEVEGMAVIPAAHPQLPAF
jgi:enamine deaminase RidA (YjgF/YER057c/UK114 family)